MRVDRAKLIRKYLRFFRLVYNLIPTYRIIVDGNFIFAGLKSNIDIVERLGKLLQGSEIKLYVMKSVVNELTAVGKKALSALEYAKEKCEIIDDSNIIGETPSDKLVKMLANLPCMTIGTTYKQADTVRNFFLATQDRDLRKEIGNIPGVPIIYFNKVTLVLEPPSESSRQYGQMLESEKVAITDSEADLLKKLSKTNVSVVSSQSVVTATPPAVDMYLERKRKRKANSPNPLSNKLPVPDSKASKRKKILSIRRK